MNCSQMHAEGAIVTRVFKKGDRVELLADADYTPYTVARSGERGTVVRSDRGDVDIEMDKHHPGLSSYGNSIWLSPDDGVRVTRLRGPKWFIDKGLLLVGAGMALGGCTGAEIADIYCERVVENFFRLIIFAFG